MPKPRLAGQRVAADPGWSRGSRSEQERQGARCYEPRREVMWDDVERLSIIRRRRTALARRLVVALPPPCSGEMGHRSLLGCGWRSVAARMVTQDRIAAVPSCRHGDRQRRSPPDLGCRKRLKSLNLA